MNKLIAIAALLLAATSAAPAPAHDQLVDVFQDNLGYYKFVFKTENISRVEERERDGTTSGSFSFIDTDGALQTVNYVAGVDGFVASGSNLPVDNNGPVEDTPEVAEARDQHLAVVESIKGLLAKIARSDDDEEVELSDAEFLDAVSEALKPTGPLIFTADTAEVAEAKGEILKSYANVLGRQAS